jgi:hypothetical protein
MVIYLYIASGTYHKPDYPACFGKDIVTKCRVHIGKYGIDCQALNLLAYPQYAPALTSLCNECFNFTDIVKIGAMRGLDKEVNTA